MKRQFYNLADENADLSGTWFHGRPPSSVRALTYIDGAFTGRPAPSVHGDFQDIAWARFRGAPTRLCRRSTLRTVTLLARHDPSWRVHEAALLDLPACPSQDPMASCGEPDPCSHPARRSPGRTKRGQADRSPPSATHRPTPRRRRQPGTVLRLTYLLAYRRRFPPGKAGGRTRDVVRPIR